MGHSEVQLTTTLPAVLLTSAVLLSCLCWTLGLGLEEKGATFFLFRKVTCIIHIAPICREVSLHKLGNRTATIYFLTVHLLPFLPDPDSNDYPLYPKRDI